MTENIPSRTFSDQGWPIERQLDAAETARAFHEMYEQLAPQFNYQTRKASAVPWVDVPERNKQLMIATVVALVQKGVIRLATDDTQAEGR